MQRFENSISSSSTGLPVSGASVLVQNYPAGTTATIYASNSLTNLATNPLTTSATGEYGFFAKNGLYQIVINGTTTIGPFLFNDLTDTDATISNTWAVPGAIGATTPSTGNFSSVSISGVNISTTYAPLASPTFTGTPAAPTASPGVNTTQIATTAFVTAAVAASTSEVAGSFRNLKLVASGLTNTSVIVTADKVTLRDASANSMGVSSVNVTINSAASGANGLDTGTSAANTWYSVWVIYNPTTSTTAGLLSASASAPTLPAGYTFYSRFGWVRTDGTVNKYLLQTRQYGRRAQYTVLASSNVPNLPVIISGTQGTVGTVGATTWVAASVANYVPTTASEIRLTLVTQYNGGVNGSAQAAPNNSYSGMFTANPAPMQQNVSNGNSAVSPDVFLLESTNVYFASGNTGGALLCLGWEDNL